MPSNLSPKYIWKNEVESKLCWQEIKKEIKFNSLASVVACVRGIPEATTD